MNDIKRVVLGGIAGGVSMLSVQMAYTWSAGQGAWAPILTVASAFRGVHQFVDMPAPVSLGMVALGLTVYLALAVLFGLLLVPVVRGMDEAATIVGFATIYGLVVFELAWFLVIPTIEPFVARTAFGFSEMIYGAVLGTMIAWPTILNSDTPLSGRPRARA